MVDSPKRSMAWKFFTDLKNRKAQCNMCGRVLSYNGGGPFNLTRHLKMVHPPIFATITVGKAKDIKPLINRASINLSTLPTTSKPNTIPGSKIINTLSSKKTNHLNKYLVELFTKQYMDLSIVESKEFKQFINELNPNYQIPDRKTLSNDLLTDYCSFSKIRIKNALEHASYVSLTTDTWTSLVANESYLSITAHFLDEQSEKQACMLECFQLNETQTLSVALTNVCDEWAITDKIVAVTSDNDSDLITAIKSNKWTQITCLAYTIDLAVQKALREIEDTQIKVRTIFEFIQSSSQESTESLQALQVKFEESPHLKLQPHEEIHWISTIEIFEQITSTWHSLPLTISKDNFDIILKSLELLSYFKAFTEEISSENNVTISEVILISNGLMRQCEQFLLNNQLPIPVRNMAECLFNELRENFHDIEHNDIFAQSTLLDPRFKKYGFSNDLAFQTALSGLKSLVSEEQFLLPMKQVEVEGEDKLLMSMNSKKPRTIWSDFDEKVNDIIIPTDRLAAGVMELNEYLQETLLPRTKCPFKWWNDKKGAYPIIYEIFKKRMCIAATSVPSERIFSKSGQNITKRRNMLSGEFVSQTVLLNFNM